MNVAAQAEAERLIDLTSKQCKKREKHLKLLDKWCNKIVCVNPNEGDKDNLKTWELREDLPPDLPHYNVIITGLRRVSLATEAAEEAAKDKMDDDNEQDDKEALEDAKLRNLFRYEIEDCKGTLDGFSDKTAIEIKALIEECEEKCADLLESGEHTNKNVAM